MTARAWTFTQKGTPSSVLCLTTGLPIPGASPPLPLPKDVPQPEEWLLVKVAYTGLNPGTLFHTGILPAMARAKTAIPEMDLSGTVLDVWTPDSPASGAGATVSSPRFRKGDGIIAFLPIKHTYPTGTGALASHVAFPARYAVPKPPNASFRDAAGLLLAACTAWQQVVNAGIKEGDRVLVNGGGGGIGTFVVQMARHVVGKSGYVVAVCSGKDGKLELMKELGADEAIDYTLHAPLHTYLTTHFSTAPFSAVIDTVGIQALYAHSASYTTPAAIYSAVGIKPPRMTLWNFVKAVWQMQCNVLWPRSPWLLGTGRQWKPVSMMDPGQELMQTVTGLLADGHIRVVVDSVWGMEEALKGYEVLEGGHPKGKILIKVDDEVE